jgi:hypothetical protein
VDPGCTTGVAVYSEGLEWLSSRQIKDFDYLCNYLDTLLAIASPFIEGGTLSLVIVCEDYIGAGRRDAPSNATRDVIGAVKSAAARHNVTLYMEAPQKRKAFVDAARTMLKVGHDGRHGADALAHVLSHIERNK